MSQIQWAIRVRCDWPGCQNTGNTTLPEGSIRPVSAEGWAYLPTGINIDGLLLRDFCPVHSQLSIRDLTLEASHEPV